MWWNCSYYVSKKFFGSETNLNWEKLWLLLRKIPTSFACSLYPRSHKSIENNKRMKTVRKGCMLAAILTVKWEPWSANKCSEKDVLVENSGRRNSRIKIFKSYMFITMCQMTSSSYIHFNWNGPNPLEVDSASSGLKIQYQNGRPWNRSDSDWGLKIRTYRN